MILTLTGKVTSRLIILLKKQLFMKLILKALQLELLRMRIVLEMKMADGDS